MDKAVPITDEGATRAFLHALVEENPPQVVATAAMAIYSDEGDDDQATDLLVVHLGANQTMVGQTIFSDAAGLLAALENMVKPALGPWPAEFKEIDAAIARAMARFAGDS